MKAGDKVRFTPIRGLNHDGKIYTIRSLGTASHEEPVVWLDEKAGYVARWAIFPLEHGLQSLNPMRHVHSSNTKLTHECR